MLDLPPPFPDDLDSERTAQIEDALDLFLTDFIEDNDTSKAGSLLVGIMVGARLYESDRSVCRTVLSTLERGTAMSLDLAPERMEVVFKDFAYRLLAKSA